MTVLMQQGKRRCDATCYNAKYDTCDCICHGRNHKKGAEHALARDHDQLLVLYLDQSGVEQVLCVCNAEELPYYEKLLKSLGKRIAPPRALHATIEPEQTDEFDLDDNGEAAE